MFRLTCPTCEAESFCGQDDAVRRLRLLGLLRREAEPSPQLVEELLVETAPRMTCPVCKAIGLRAAPAEDEWDDVNWQAAVLCEICRQPIATERLDAVPDAKRCVPCQDAVESGTATDDEPEFCPKCGALLEIRISRGAGITRYKRFCTGIPSCRL